MLSQTDYAPQSGANVMNDFVEAPSQMFQEWARRAQPLALFGKVCPECPQLGADEIRRIENARKFGLGIFYAQQWLNASYDMALTSDKPEPALALWQRMEGETPLGYVEGTLYPAGFVHLAGGYGAGYYGYMWSEVLALDMLSVFGNNLLDPKVGKRYRDTILAQGGQRYPAQLVKDFLGREPNSEAFFAEITGRR
jgi:thimet oligopeptidase